jgi:hypothetical protein
MPLAHLNADRRQHFRNNTLVESDDSRTVSCEKDDFKDSTKDFDVFSGRECLEKSLRIDPLGASLLQKEGPAMDMMIHEMAY